MAFSLCYLRLCQVQGTRTSIAPARFCFSSGPALVWCRLGPERGRRYEEDRPALSSEQPRERREHSAIGGGLPRTCDLATQFGELMTEHGDLDVLFVGSRTGPKQPEQLANEEEGDRKGPRR